MRGASSGAPTTCISTCSITRFTGCLRWQPKAAARAPAQPGGAHRQAIRPPFEDTSARFYGILRPRHQGRQTIQRRTFRGGRHRLRLGAHPPAVHPAVPGSRQNRLSSAAVGAGTLGRENPSLYLHLLMALPGQRPGGLRSRSIVEDSNSHVRKSFRRANISAWRYSIPEYWFANPESGFHDLKPCAFSTGQQLPLYTHLRFGAAGMGVGGAPRANLAAIRDFPFRGATSTLNLPTKPSLRKGSGSTGRLWLEPGRFPHALIRPGSRHRLRK